MDSLIRSAKDLLASIPLSTIQAAKAEQLKVQIETMEFRLKLAEDRQKAAEEKANRLEKENVELKEEAEKLREIVAASGLTEEYFKFDPFVFKKGDTAPRCPDCRTTLNVKGREFKCRKCGWEYEDRSISPGSLNISF